MVLLAACSALLAQPEAGALRVGKKNPRYFTDGSGKAVYLTCSHPWSSLQDMGYTDPPAAFDFDGYNDFLEIIITTSSGSGAGNSPNGLNKKG
jgi:hypothetical protein